MSRGRTPAEAVHALTNMHGLRLAVVSGRIGFPPSAASPARDAIEAAGGFPVVIAGRPPISVPGCDGDVIALELRASVHPAAVHPREGAAALELEALDRPLPLDAAKAVWCASQTQADEFAAGLGVLSDVALQLPVKVDPDRFDRGDGGQPSGILADPEANTSAASAAWREALAWQERVSSGFLLTALAGSDDGGDELLREWRRGVRRGGRRNVGRPWACAQTFAALDPITGWTALDVEAAIRAADRSLGDFASATIAGSDPFGDAPPREPQDAVEVAVALLLGCQGLTATQLADKLAAAAHGMSTTATALLGMSIGRSSVPGRYRPPALDRRLIHDEIRTARVVVRRLGRANDSTGAQVTGRSVPQMDSLWGDSGAGR